MAIPSKSPSRSSISAFLRLEALEAREVPAIIGTIDPTFGSAGIAQTGVTVKNTVDIPDSSISSDGVLPQGAMAVDSSGQTVVVGDGGDWVERLGPDGSVDTTFGSGGSVNLSSYGFSPVSVAIDANNNIVILGEKVQTSTTGTVQVKPVLIRLTSTGSLDTTFGTNGIDDVTLPNGGGSTSPLWVRGLAIDPQGRIVVVGGSGPSYSGGQGLILETSGESSYPMGLEVFRLTPNGQLDTSFGTNGFVGPFLSPIAVGASLEATGQIVVAGSSVGTPQPSVLRLNPDGSIDPALPGDAAPPSGSPFTDGSYTFTTAVTTDSAGDIFLGGSTDQDLAFVIKLTAAGAVDTTFGTGGLYTSPLLGAQSTNVSIGALAVLPDGEVLAAQQAVSTYGATAGLAVFGLTTSGQLDKTFNPNGAIPGINEFSLNGGQSANGLSGMALTPNGDIEVLGFSGSANTLAVARLIGPDDPNVTLPVPPVPAVPPYPVGTLDPTFGNGEPIQTGIVTVHQGTPSVAVDSSGRTILVADGGFLQVQRLNPDGSPDLTFGRNGDTNVSVEGADQLVGNVETDAAGDIFIAGTTQQVTSSAALDYIMPFVVKLTPTGALDPSFGNDGIAILPGTWDTYDDSTLIIDPNGDLVVVGTTPGGETVAQLTPSGALDPTFNGGNVEVIPGTSNLTEATATIDSSGRIVIAGTTNSYRQFSVTRLNSDGSLDTSFAGTGILDFAITTGDLVNVASVATDAAGNIFLGGEDGTQQVIVKLTSSGSLDSTFGTGGAFVNLAGTGFAAPEGNPIVGLVVLPNDEVIAAGSIAPSENQNTSQFVVFELTASGTLDSMFNADGPTPGENVFGTPAGSTATSMALSPSGDIVVAGYGGNGVGYGMQVARLIGPDDPRVSTPTPPPPPGAPFTAQPVPPPTPGIIPPTSPFASLGVSVRTAVGDVNGDGTDDTIYVTGPGTPVRVEVISGTNGSTVLVPAFDPFGDNFTGGAWVVAADFNHSGRDQIVIAADVGGGPRIVIWELLPNGQMQEDASFYGISDSNFRGGTRIAVGDINDDGTPDLVVVAGYGGGPRVAIFDGRTILSGNPTKLVNDFYVFQSADETSLRNGLYVAVGDVNGDGYADIIIGAGEGGGPRVIVLSGKTLVEDGATAAIAGLLANFFVGGSDSSRSGVAVAVTNDANDGVADIVAGLPAGTVSVPLAGETETKVPVYAGSTLSPGSQPTPAVSIDPSTDITLSGIFVG